MSNQGKEIPHGSLDNFKRNWKADAMSGFLVFLIALPLCLAISVACGYPAIAGVYTAIIGGILSAFLSNSEMTIKGPAAGLIVVALACVTEFGFTGGENIEADIQAYRLALGVGVVAGLVQVFLAIMRSGALSEFFPAPVVHGLLASIGVLVIATQLPIMLGVQGDGAPLERLASIPSYLFEMNPAIALIGGISLLIMFGFTYIKNPKFRIIPAPMLVLIVAVPLGIYFDIGNVQSISYFGIEHTFGPQYLVNVPDNMFSAMVFPDFSGVFTAVGIKYIIMFALIGSIESVLSAKAVDQIDPWRRKTNFDKDLLAVGAGNTLASFIGGLPMISEIARSKANIDNGARTRFSNLFHGVFLLGFIALVPALINQIPLAALAAMLVFTGFRLASPKEFIHMYQVGREQFIVFLTTIIAVLATDLLMGIFIGLLTKAILHIINGAPIRSVFMPSIEVTESNDETAIVKVSKAVIFSNWLPVKQAINRQRANKVMIDLSNTNLVGHSVMANLHQIKDDFERVGRELAITGIEAHQPLSRHQLAALKAKA